MKDAAASTVSHRISVIIPTLQEESCIARTLRQFKRELRQKYALEIIVSDGGSTDRTIEIARSFADCVVERDPKARENISLGRNHGARVAHGDILVFINADVIIERPDEFFSTIITTVAQENVAAATCNVLIYPEEENGIDRVFHRFFNWYFRLLNVFGMGMGRGECHVMRREIFERVGGYNEVLAAGEDYELYHRLHQKGEIAFLRSIKVFESPRRYRRFGYFYITFLWFLNGIWVLLFKRSFVEEWKPVR
ncbi:MAG: glycosyltransferase [Ignavibacteriae bacterium]|nr:glycosyltransferase [Ignavibacteria bacterium]MBI3364963.1 glycosyltransferase [Ignavibacteriota bacterium]